MVNQKFEIISLDEGLSQSVVYTMLQDRSGFMWFGTQDGLNRYDGFKFKVFKNDNSDGNSIPNNYVRILFEDKEGILWLGTLNGFLSRYEKKNEHFINYKMNDLIISRKTKMVTSLCEDSCGYLWVGGLGSGLNKFDKENEKFINVDWENNFGFSMDMDINCLLKDSDDLIWIGTKFNGLYAMNLKENKIHNYKNNPGDNTTLSHNFVVNLFEDSNKNIYVCTKDGLNILSKVNKTFERYYNEPDNPESISNSSTNCVCEDKNNTMWIGTISDGLNRFDLNKKKFQRFKPVITDPNSLQTDSIFSLYCGRGNVLWIGTFGGGIHKLDCSAKDFFSVTKLQSSSEIESIKDIRSIFIDNFNFLWIGTFKKGIYKISPDGINFKKYNCNEKIASAKIMSFFQDKNLNIWIGIWEGSLCLYDRELDDFSFYRFSEAHPDYIYSISGDADGNFLYIGTHTRGLLKFDIEAKQYLPVSSNHEINNKLSGLVIKNVIHGEDKNLFLCTAGNGLLNYDYGKNILTEYDAGISRDDLVLTVYDDKKNTLWIGCQLGLNKFCKNGKGYRKYTTEDGLPDNIVNGIYEDEDGSLWLSTNNGISKFKPDDESFKNYDGSDGLQSKEFNDGAHFKSKEGTIYFGGINGYTYFKPENIKDNTFKPDVAITDFSIFNKSVRPSPENPFLKWSINETKEIILSYRESVFSFEFASLIYNNSQKNQYAYMMERFDDDWVYCGSRRQATYTNLNPGQYTFRVKGSNNDNIWSDDEASLKITITPPFWKTLLFKSVSLLGIFAAAGLTYNQRLAKIKKEKALQEEFSRKLIESQESERKRVAAELHDSLGQDLLIIKNKALISIKKTDDIEKFREQMNEISELTSSTINEVREISYNLRPYELDRLGLLKTLQSLIDRAGKSTNISFNCEIDNIDNVFVPEIEINIYRIVQECLSNIIKHSEATQVVVSIKKHGKEITIFISDNGKGFNVEKKFSDTERKGFGLRGIPERVKLFGGEFKIESETGRGTRIKIIMPVPG